MSAKSVSIFSMITTLFILILPLFSAAQSNGHGKKQSRLEFLKHLQGCHKGDNINGINQLKKYLHVFGYLQYKNNSPNQTRDYDDLFDDLLESSIKTCQLIFHLQDTGTLDSKTLSTMPMPQCGMLDIVNGTTRMRSGKKSSRHHLLHTVSHYSFFSGNPRWPPSKYHLTYGLVPGTRADAMSPLARAFATWAANTHFTITRAGDPNNVDIRIGFFSGDHGDGIPFDGNAGRTIAHAFAPMNGWFHYDADEPWAVGAMQDAFDMETVALHEIGHLLGLHHSDVEGAIMWPIINEGMTKGLHQDDIQGIRALYNV